MFFRSTLIIECEVMLFCTTGPSARRWIFFSDSISFYKPKFIFGSPRWYFKCSCSFTSEVASLDNRILLLNAISVFLSPLIFFTSTWFISIPQAKRLFFCTTQCYISAMGCFSVPPSVISRDTFPRYGQKHCIFRERTRLSILGMWDRRNRQNVQ